MRASLRLSATSPPQAKRRFAHGMSCNHALAFFRQVPPQQDIRLINLVGYTHNVIDTTQAVDPSRRGKLCNCHLASTAFVYP